MNKKVNYLITDHNITVNFEGQTHIVPRTDALADQLIKAVKEQKLEDIPKLVSIAKRIETMSKGSFIIKDGQIFVNGVLAPQVLGNKILKFSNEGLPFEPLVKFAEKLQLNPSFRAVNELFQFLERNNHPITEEGNFIAYKKVKDDFTDVHTGTFDNSPGQVVSVPRNQVDEDCTRVCSNGLHCANFNYAVNFYVGGKMLEVEVNPKDVVSVPNDYNFSKMRVCEYKVLGVVDHAHSEDMSIRFINPLKEDAYVVDTCANCFNDVNSEYESNFCSTCEDDFDLCGGCENVFNKDNLSFDKNLCDECEEDADEYPWEDEV